MNSKTPKLASNSIRLSAATVDVKFDIIVQGRTWDVEGFLDIRTGEFTPSLIGVFSVRQFVDDSGLDMDAFAERLRNMVKKNLNW